MSAHRVITDLVGLEGCQKGTILLDNEDDTVEKSTVDWLNGVERWLCGADSVWEDIDIALPARVLIESWER